MLSYRRPGLTLAELLVVVAIVAVLIGLIVPAVQKVRAAAQKTACADHLRQIGLASHNYHGAMGHLPAGCSYRNGRDPQPHMSWLTRLLPYLEQDALWQQAVAAFAQAKFFERPPHLPILGQHQPTFVCPADDRSAVPHSFGRFSAAFTDYLGVAGNDAARHDGVLYLDSETRLADVTDGTSNTLLAGERPPSVNRDFGWWYAGWGQNRDGSAESTLGVRELRVYRRYRACPAGPYKFEPSPPDDHCATFHFWSFHTAGAHFLFCDGSVRFLAYSADAVLPALSTRAGGEATPSAD
ncbi:MAG: DUF1559 domain-containing protein [Gemmataceae bacterium]